MPKHVVVLIRLWMTEHFTPNADGLIFIGSRKVPPQTHYFHANNWRPLLKRAGLYVEGEKDSFHFNALRHFSASWLVETLPLTDVAHVLGDSKFDMTLQVYAHPMANGQRRHEAVDGIAARIVPAPPALPTCAPVARNLLSA